MTQRFIDIHSHLNEPRFDADISETLTRMREASVASIVVGTDRVMSERATLLAEKEPDIWATIGLHPTDNHKEEFDDAAYLRMAAHPRVVAIGECGLDYYWPTQNLQNQRPAALPAAVALGQDNSSSPLRHSSPAPRMASDSVSSDAVPQLDFENEKKRQRDIFIRQIGIAKEVQKPLMIHGRPSRGSMDAYEDILTILSEFPDVVGNVHFFVGNVDIARRFLDRGFTMSFTGVLTFTSDYDETVRFLPLDRIHAETDAPYVAPIPYRGKRNEPAYVRETVRAFARIRDISEEELAPALLANAARVFGPLG